MNKEALLTIVEEIVTLQSKVNKDMSEALGIVETEVHTFGSTREEQSKIPNIINSLFDQITNRLLNIHKGQTLEEIKEKVSTL